MRPSAPSGLKPAIHSFRFDQNTTTRLRGHVTPTSLFNANGANVQKRNAFYEPPIPAPKAVNGDKHSAEPLSYPLNDRTAGVANDDVDMHSDSENVEERELSYADETPARPEFVQSVFNSAVEPKDRSEKTVERHLSHIFAKLQVSSRSGATRVAVQAGIA